LIRVFISNLALSKQVIVNGNQYHYLSKVMRCRISDHIIAFNTLDGEFECVILASSRSEMVLQPLKLLRFYSNKDKKITLAFSLLKGDNIELVVQKATELGVDSILPLLTERSIVRNIKKERLEAIAIEASEQSGRIDIPKIEQLIKITDLDKLDFDLGIFCDEKERSGVINQLSSKIDYAKSILIIVGPEGGFSDKERSFMRSLDFINSVSISSNILRAETAAISVIAIVQSVLLK
jgi:16S rRNA (uracil1498-N3)-methyltransferase